MSFFADFVSGFVEGWRGREGFRAPVTLDDHIEATKSAALRTERRMWAIVGELNEAYPSGYCCPGCASSEWRQLSQKQERRLPWLAVMLRKQGVELRLASKIEDGLWP